MSASNPVIYPKNSVATVVDVSLPQPAPGVRLR